MTYEYLCTECGHAWEAEQSISAAPLKSCPNCHKDGAKRQVSGGAGFILKGGGWYADLYGSAPKKSSSDGDAKPADKSDSSAKDSSTKDASAKDASAKKDSTSGDGGSKGTTGSGSSGSSTSGSSGSSGTPTSGTPSGSKATGAASGA